MLKKLFAAAMLVALMPSCPSFGVNVANQALFETAQLGWPEIRSDMVIGVADGLSEGDLVSASVSSLEDGMGAMDTALKQKDLDALRLVPWSSMKPWPERGIDVQMHGGQIGAGVAESFRENLKQFDLVIRRLRKPRGVP